MVMPSNLISKKAINGRGGSLREDWGTLERWGLQKQTVVLRSRFGTPKIVLVVSRSSEFGLIKFQMIADRNARVAEDSNGLKELREFFNERPFVGAPEL